MTRPEPTIYGNCEGWNFIVGKKPEANSLKIPISLSLRTSNRDFMHNLFTILHRVALDNLWVICESTVNNHECHEIENVGCPVISKRYESSVPF